MLASELIIQLQELISAHGDKPVELEVDDDFYNAEINMTGTFPYDPNSETQYFWVSGDSLIKKIGDGLNEVLNG